MNHIVYFESIYNLSEHLAIVIVITSFWIELDLAGAFIIIFEDIVLDKNTDNLSNITT